MLFWSTSCVASSLKKKKKEKLARSNQPRARAIKFRKGKFRAASSNPFPAFSHPPPTTTVKPSDDEISLEFYGTFTEIVQLQCIESDENSHSHVTNGPRFC